MSIFSTILHNLGIGKPATPAPTVQPVAPAPTVKPAAPASTVKPATPAPTVKPAVHTPTVKPVMSSGPIVIPSAPAVARPAAVPVVDVVSKLESLAGSGSGLDWKVSIVDLLKLLGIDSSFSARKELATELGCPANLMGDSASMNVWLHKTVLQKIAENGGNIPESLLH